MKKKFEYLERRGLPGGPNETFSYTTGVFSTEGYKRYSPDVNNPFNIIPSGNITMKDVDFPVEGTDNLGNSIMMRPGYDYKFPGNMVFERPIKEEKAVKPYGSINTFGNMAVAAGGLKSKNLDIEARYAKLLEQLGESTGSFNFGVNAKANKNNYQFNINPNITLSGDKPRIGINAGIKKTFRKGGGLLTKNMKCNNCGWSWRGVDGGKDATTCHKCGGSVLPKAQKGKENITYLPDRGGYQVPVDLETGNIKGGILPEVIVSGKATPLVRHKRAYETNNPFDAQQYATDLFNNPKSREEYFDRFNKDRFFQKYGQRGYNEFQDNAWKYAAEQRMSQLPQGNRSRIEYLNDLTAKEEELFKKYNPALQTTYSADFVRAVNAKDRESYDQLKDKLYNGPEKDLYTEREKQNMLQNYKYIGGVHGGDALAPLTWMSKPIQSIYRDDYSGYDALVGRKNDATFKEDLITDPTLIFGLAKTGFNLGAKGLRAFSKSFIPNLDDVGAQAFKPLKANPSSSSVSKLGIKQEIPKPIKKQELNKFVKQEREKLFPDDLENAPKQTAQFTDKYEVSRIVETSYPKINPTKEYTNFKSKIKGTPDDDYLFRLTYADYMSSNKGSLIDPLPINVQILDGDLKKFTRPSVHFSKNHIVSANSGGHWMDVPTIIMSKEDDILKTNSGFRKNKFSADSDTWIETMGDADALYYPKETTHIITGEPKMALQAKKLGYNVLYSDELNSLHKQIKKLQKKEPYLKVDFSPEYYKLADEIRELETKMNTYKQSIVNDLANTTTKKNIKGLDTSSYPNHSLLSQAESKYFNYPDATLDPKYARIEETPAFKNLKAKSNELTNQYKTLTEKGTVEEARAFFDAADGERIVSLASAPQRIGLTKNSPEYLRAISEFGEGINAPTKKVFRPAANYEQVQQLKNYYDIPEWHANFLLNQKNPKKLSYTGNKYRLGFYQDGGQLPKAQEGIEGIGKEVNNFKDFVITNEEIDFLNSNKKEYCPKGNCLESTKKAFNLTAGKIKGVPDMYNVFENDLKVTSAKGKPTEKMIESNPWFAGDVNVSSSDSWDVQGNILNSEGQIVYNRNNRESVYYPGKAAIGSIYSFGPKGKKYSEFENRNQGYNTKFGLQPSHHSVSVVGFNKESNENVLYDSYLNKYLTESELIKELDEKKGYELETIGTPKSYVNFTRENLESSDNFYNPNIMSSYKVDVNNLKKLTRDPAVKYTYIEDGKEKYRQPGFNSDAMKGFVTSLEDNKEVIMEATGISNEKYDRLADLAIAIAMAETEGGDELSFDWLGKTQGLTQLNYDNIKDDEVLQKTIDKINDKVSVTNKINSISDLRTPSTSAIATIAYLSKFEDKAKNLLEKGEMPSERTFYDNTGFKDNFRYSSAKINKDGFYVDAIDERIPFDKIEGWKEKDINKVTRYLNELTSTNDYNAILDDNGKIAITMKTKGNKMDMPYGKTMAYFWQSPNTLATGDAQGKSVYASRVSHYYDKIQDLKKNSKNSDLKYQKGGEYTVQAGNTFDGIANLKEVPKDLLRKANPDIDYNNIKVGQVINIPDAPKTKEERMEFSSGRKRKDLTENILSANKLENYLAESRGNTPEFWKATADTIAYHESGPWQRMDPKAIQRSQDKGTGEIFQGPGEGLFQIETDRAGGSNSFSTFKNRYANIAEALDMDADPEIMNAERPIDLPAEKQYTLFYSNLIESPDVKLKDYVDGKLSLEDLWLKGHKIKEAKGDRENFQESVQNARKKGIPFTQIGEETSDLEMYKNYINGLYDGTEMEAAAQRLYDKLNRVYYRKAKGLGMSVPNYIMTNIINRTN